MSKDFKFSVSICVYGKDNPEHFDEAIESIVNQTIKPDEIVLVVDGPIPDSINNVIEKYKMQLNDIVFNVVYLENNMGHGEARRICFDNCKYEYIALMDADDISIDSRFEKQIEYFKNNKTLSIVGGNIEEFISDTSNCVGKRIVPNEDSGIKLYMKKRCPMNQVTVMFKKSDVEDVGGYVDWYCEEDYYLWIRMALANKTFANINETLVHVRVGDEMYGRRGGIKYFRSEASLQKYMLDNEVISFGRYLINVFERLVLQVLMPNKLRGFIFQKFART